MQKNSQSQLGDLKLQDLKNNFYNFTKNDDLYTLDDYLLFRGKGEEVQKEIDSEDFPSFSSVESSNSSISEENSGNRYDPHDYRNSQKFKLKLQYSPQKSQNNRAFSQ